MDTTWWWWARGLAGRDPRRKPVIDQRFLSDEGGHDLEVLLDGLALARRLEGRKPLDGSIARELEPGRRVVAEASLRTYVRRDVDGYSHPVGTCRMGPDSDQMAVVDAAGRVRGLENVTVADASVMPLIPRANTNLSCMLVGLRIAELLKVS